MAKEAKKRVIKYGSGKQRELEIIKEAFIDSMNLNRGSDEPDVEIPNEFTTETVSHWVFFERERVLNPGGERARSIVSSFEEHIASGHLLSMDARLMSQMIIEYVSRCRAQLLWSDHRFDPTEQFLSEFFRWIKRLSFVDKIDKKLENEVQRRLCYLSKIERADDGRFWEERYEFSRRMLIGDLKDVLQRNVMHIIKVHPDGQSIREELDILSKGCKEQISALVMCLRLALHNPPEKNMHIDLLAQAKQSFSSPSGNFVRTRNELSKTVSGKLVLALCNELVEIESWDGRKPRTIASREAASRSIAVAPGDPLDTPARLDHLVVAQKLSTSSNHGLISQFAIDPTAIHAYISLCNLLLELACISNLIKKAHLLAGEGGNILMCGYVHRHTAMLTDSYIAVLDGIRKNLAIIGEKRAGYDAKLQPSKKRKGEKPSWSKNSRIYDRHLTIFTNSESASRAITDQITARLKRFQREDWYNAVRRGIDIYTKEAEMIYERVCNPGLISSHETGKFNLLLKGEPAMMRATDEPARLTSRAIRTRGSLAHSRGHASSSELTYVAVDIDQDGTESLAAAGEGAAPMDMLPLMPGGEPGESGVEESKSEVPPGGGEFCSGVGSGDYFPAGASVFAGAYAGAGVGAGAGAGAGVGAGAGAGVEAYAGAGVGAGAGAGAGVGAHAGAGVGAGVGAYAGAGERAGTRVGMRATHDPRARFAPTADSLHARGGISTPPGGDVFNLAASPRAAHFDRVQEIKNRYRPRIALKQGVYGWRTQVAIDRRLEHMRQLDEMIRRWQNPGPGQTRPLAGELLGRLNEFVRVAKTKWFGMTAEYEAMQDAIYRLQRDMAALRDTNGSQELAILRHRVERYKREVEEGRVERLMMQEKITELTAKSSEFERSDLERKEEVERLTQLVNGLRDAVEHISTNPPSRS